MDWDAPEASAFKARQGLLIRDAREPQRDLKVQMDAALYAALLGMFREWARQIAARAQAELGQKAMPNLLQPDDMSELTRILLPMLERAALSAIDNSTDDLERLFSVSFDPTGVNTQAALWARQHTGQLVRNVYQNTKNRIGRAVENYITARQNIGELTSAINAIVHNPQRAATIAQTEITRAFAQGNTLTWQESGIVQGKQWNTNADELVCPICKPLNGQARPLQASFGINVFHEPMLEPPGHPNCRCWVTPVSRLKKRG